MVEEQTRLSPNQPVRPRAGRGWRKTRLGVALGLFILGGALVLESARVLLGSNFHVLEEGRVYRGAQPTSEDIADMVSRYHIRTIVNLRGCCDPYDWYMDESRASQNLGVAQEDVCLSSGRLPSDPELRRLVEILDQAEYPLFFHCRRGADRTGLASAVYLLLKTDASLGSARKQLGLRYGHVAIGRPVYLDQFFDLYETWLRNHHQGHSCEGFRHWLLNEYRGGGLCYQVEKIICTNGKPHPGRPNAFRVRVRNTGYQIWKLSPCDGAGTRLGFNLRDDHEKIVASGFWGIFEGEVRPGQAMDFTLVIPSLPPGRYFLVLDMVDPKQGWFFQTGTEPFEEELIIGG